MNTLTKVVMLLILLLCNTVPVFAHETIQVSVLSGRQTTPGQIAVNANGVTDQSGINALTALVWSANNSQDDKREYEMVLKGDGSYEGIVNLGDHGNDDGLYYIWLYGTDRNGLKELIEETYVIIFADRNQWTRFSFDGTEYKELTYHAALNVTSALKPNVLANNEEKLKSGYGFSLAVDSKTRTNEGASAAHALTGIQNMNVLFPEFNYEKGVTLDGKVVQFNRRGFLEKTSVNQTDIDTTMSLKENEFSTSKSRVHFTPLWFPNTVYKTYVEVFDSWTPGGMLATTFNSDLKIDGNVYDDWHVAPK